MSALNGSEYGSLRRTPVTLDSGRMQAPAMVHQLVEPSLHPGLLGVVIPKSTARKGSLLPGAPVSYKEEAGRAFSRLADKLVPDSFSCLKFLQGSRYGLLGWPGTASEFIVMSSEKGQSRLRQHLIRATRPVGHLWVPVRWTDPSKGAPAGEDALP